MNVIILEILILYNSQCFLAQEPQILTVPAFPSGRYWIVPFLDAYTNFYSAIGSDYNSTPGDYLVLGQGKLWVMLTCVLHHRQASAGSWNQSQWVVVHCEHVH